MVTLRTTLTLLFIAIIFHLNAQTHVSGFVSGTWNADGNPYIVENSLYIDMEERLSINEGVELYFDDNHSIEVFGRLDVNGSEEFPVLITLKDTTGFADGEAGWQGINFSGGGNSGEISVLEHCIIEYSNNNGVTCTDYSPLEVHHAELRNNRGFGLAAYMFSNILVNGVKIHHNGSGGMDIDFSTPEVNNFIIEQNNGPGIRLFGDLNGGNPTYFTNGEIRYNKNDGQGGGISLSYNYTVEMDQVDIFQNEAAQGGGIYTTDGSVNMNHVRVGGNFAHYGGGMYVDYGTQLDMQYVVIADNEALYDGGAIYLEESSMDLIKSTITNNEAGNEGGGLSFHVSYAGASNMNSSIIWGNYPDDLLASSVLPVVTYSNLGEIVNGTGNISGDPLFMDAETGNYQLSWNDYPAINDSKSPCIDAGDPDLPMDPDGTTADIGAYYFFQTTITSTTEDKPIVLQVFPNPASDRIRITGEEQNMQVMVLNMSGSLVMEQKDFNPGDELTISSLSPGLYFVRVSGANGKTETIKLIKE